MNFVPIDSTNLARCAELFVGVFNSAPWNENWSLESATIRLNECFGTPGFYGLLAEDEGESLGFALGYIEQWDKHRHFYLKEMCVASSRQRSGVGSELISTLENKLQKQGVQKVYLYTAHGGGAQNFYDKQGFHTNPKMVMMAKRLTKP